MPKRPIEGGVDPERYTQEELTERLSRPVRPSRTDSLASSAMQTLYMGKKSSNCKNRRKKTSNRAPRDEHAVVVGSSIRPPPCTPLYHHLWLSRSEVEQLV